MPEPYFNRVFGSLRHNCVRWVVFVLTTLPAFSQITVSFPTSRIVFQRSQANKASFVVAGMYKQSIPDRIEAALTPLNAGQGTATGWQVLENAPVGGVFSGEISAEGGWYKLEVRLIRNGQVAETTEVDRVGVGEVFVVAGQSNARGIQNYGASGAIDDRVSCFNYLNSNFEPNELPQPTFSHLNADSYIAPYGYSAWSWGVLGDLLVKRLNVPILFYNAALEGTTSRAWRESLYGNASNPYVGGFYGNQLPYSQLRVTLREFASLTGIRAILWHQGESDTGFNIPEDEIVSNLQQIIGQSRNDFGHNLSWVVSRVSFSENGSSASVINAQNRVIGSVYNVFAGPATDNIQIPRPDKVHMQGAGLTLLGEAWNNSLTDSFFQSSQPRNPFPIPTFKVSCAGENRVKLSIQANNYPEVNWNQVGGGSREITVENGTYRVKVRDYNGNFVYSPTVEINQQTFEALPKPAIPIITASGGTSFCEGDQITLAAPEASAYQWSNGSNGRTIEVSETNQYTVRIKDANECWSGYSAVTSTVKNPRPSVPTIIAKGPLEFCNDKNVVLEIENGATLSTTNSFLWNSGQNATSITVRESGRFSARTVNQYNCFSQFSVPVTVTVHPTPETPVISPSGLVRFCEREAVTLYSNTSSSVLWNNGATSTNLLVRQSGKYSLIATNEHGCVSAPSKEVEVEVSPIPAQPSIEKTGNYILNVKGDYLSDIQFRWNYGLEETITVEKYLKAKKSGPYTVTAFYFLEPGRACSSLTSERFDYVLDVSGNGVNVYPNPSLDGVFLLESFEDLTDVKMQVMDLNGKLMLEQETPLLSNSQPLRLTPLPSGTYLLKVRSFGKPIFTKKLLVIR